MGGGRYAAAGCGYWAAGPAGGLPGGCPAGAPAAAAAARELLAGIACAAGARSEPAAAPHAQVGRGQKLGDSDNIPFSEMTVEDLLEIVRRLPPEASAVKAIAQVRTRGRGHGLAWSRRARRGGLTWRGLQGANPRRRSGSRAVAGGAGSVRSSHAAPHALALAHVTLAPTPPGRSPTPQGLYFFDSGALAALLKELNKSGHARRAQEVRPARGPGLHALPRALPRALPLAGHGACWKGLGAPVLRACAQGSVPSPLHPSSHPTPPPPLTRRAPPDPPLLQIFDWLRTLDDSHDLYSLCTTMTYTTMISQVCAVAVLLGCGLGVFGRV